MYCFNTIYMPSAFLLTNQNTLLSVLIKNVPFYKLFKYKPFTEFAVHVFGYVIHLFDCQNSCITMCCMFFYIFLFCFVIT